MPIFTKRIEKSIVLVEEMPLEEVTPSWWKRHWLKLALGAVVLALLTVLAVYSFRTLYPTVITDLDAGRELYYQGHYTASVKKLRDFVLKNPDDAEAKTLLAQGLIQLKQGQPAANYLLDVLKQRLNDPAANYWLGRAYMVDKKFDQAEPGWQKLITTNDPNYKARALLWMGDLRYQQNRFEEARRYLSEALNTKGSLEPLEAYRLNYLYGLLLLGNTRFDEAREQFKKAALVKPEEEWRDNGPQWWAIYQGNERIRLITAALPAEANNQPETAQRTKAGYALLIGEEFGLAEEQFVRVLQITPGFVDAQAYLASIYWRTGRVGQAQNYLYAVLKTDPANRFARQVFVQLLIDQLQKATPATNSTAEVEKARSYANELLQGLIKERPDDPLLQVDLARFYIVQGKYSEAESSYFTAMDLNGKKPVQGLNLQVLLLQLYTEIGVDPCQRGGVFAEKVLKDYPSDPDSWYWAGTSNLRCGKYNLAITQFQKALELKPYWPLATYRLGLAFTETEDINRGTEYQDMAYDLEPNPKWIRRD